MSHNITRLAADLDRLAALEPNANTPVPHTLRHCAAAARNQNRRDFVREAVGYCVTVARSDAELRTEEPLRTRRMALSHALTGIVAALVTDEGMTLKQCADLAALA